MLTLLKYYLRLAITPVLYFSGFYVMFRTLLRDVRWGFWLMIFLIPMPNLWYTLHQYPMGKDFLDLLYLSILLGLVVQAKGFDSSRNSVLVLLFVGLSYVSLWKSSIEFSLPIPLSTANLVLLDWKNYAQMICFYFIAMNTCKSEKDQKYSTMLIAFTILIIGVRSFRNFSGGVSFDYNKRVGGPFEAAGLGANHLGAFIADYSSFLLGLSFFEKERYWWWLLTSAFFFSLHPLLFSYSRGAYIAALAVLLCYGLLQKRVLLVAGLVFLLAWNTILPVSVVDRINMTQNENGEFESSAASRLDLWNRSIDLFGQNPVFGLGFSGFQLKLAGEPLTDTHNFFLKTLVESGIVGLVFLFIILIRALGSGWCLYTKGKTDFQRGLGLGFLGCSVSMVLTNIFGDRWSYFPIGSFFWVLWGFTDRSIMNAEKLNAIDGTAV